MSWRSRLVVTEAGERSWTLVQDLVYEGSRDTFTVPAGFRTDFASVPRVFWTTFPPYGRYTKAAVLHDFLYSHAANVTRKDADGLFRRVTLEDGTRRWRANLMYRAVRWFGKRNWKKR